MLLLNDKTMKILLLILISFYSFGQKIIYVGGTGATDTNTGTTATQPFATIQKAASIAVAGDIVKIRSGTYRETVVPANSGTNARIVYQPDQGATVIISGLNEAGNTGWLVHSGNIYKKAITLPVNGYAQTFPNNTTLAANQVFRNSIMQIEARWPKMSTVTDLLDRSKIRQRNSTSLWNATTITDSGIPNIPGGWGGGKIWLSGWFIAQTRTISSSSGSTINFPATNGDMRYSQYYYLTGKLGALTQAKEWHYENGTLYFWQEGGGSPTGVEYKARNWGFDLRGKSNITIQGLQFIGCEINADVNSANTIIDNIKASYTNQTFLQAGYFTNSLQTGMKVIGPNSVIKNSEIKYGASAGIWLGEKCRAENNLISDFNWEGNYAAGIGFWGKTGNQVVTRNTIARMGRSAMDFSTEFMGQHLNIDIGYNDIYHGLMLSSDGGQIYAAVDNNLTGSRFHHNWIHDSKSERTPSVGYTVGIAAGMYLDQASGPVVFDHNVLWNNAECDFHTWQDDRKHRNAGKSFLWNNTFASNYGNTYYGNNGYLTIVTWFSDEIRNCIFKDKLAINWDPPRPGIGDVQNTQQEFASYTPAPNSVGIGAPVDSKFLGTGEGGLKYRLAAGAPGINAGQLAGGIKYGVPAEEINKGAVGMPDIGAYEFGGVAWVPGYKSVTTPPVDPPDTVIIPPDTVVIPPPVPIVTTPRRDSTFILNGRFTMSSTGPIEVAINYTEPIPPSVETKIYDDLVSTKYVGPWAFNTNSCCGWSLNTLNYTNVPTSVIGGKLTNSTITFTFKGHNVKWFAERKASTHGKASIVIDNKSAITIDLSGLRVNPDGTVTVINSGVDFITKKPSWDSGNLTEGTHTVTITVMEARYVVHDYFQIEFNK